MRISVAFACLAFVLVTAGCGRSIGSDARSPAGTWEGTLMTPSGGLRLAVHIEGKAGAWTGRMESLDQGGDDIPLEVSAIDADHLALRAPSLDGRFEGTWSDSLTAWNGRWMQSGFKLPLALRRAPDKPRVVDGLDGKWEGAVERDGQRLRLILNVTTDARGTVATFDAPDAGAMRLEVKELSRTADHVRFTVALTHATFDGVIAEGGGSMSGEWRFPGRPTTQVTLVRANETTGDASIKASPETPYRVLDAHFDNHDAAGICLAGTLTLPEGSGPFPAVVLLSGTGAHDRDESMFGHRPFADLADHLTRQGIAVLRFDDRGVNGSTGVYSAASARDLASDAGSAVEFLRARDEIDPRAIGLVGHSEGGAHAAMAASEDPNIAFVILLASPGLPMRDVLLEQHRAIGTSRGLPAEQLERGSRVLAAIFDAIAGAPSDDEALVRVRSLLTTDARADLSLDEPGADLFAQQMARSGIRNSLGEDPATYLAQVHVPVLALGGSLDQQVESKSNLAAIGEALRTNPDVTVRELPGINHLLQTARTGSIAEYSEIQATLAPQVPQMVSDWIHARFPRAARS